MFYKILRILFTFLLAIIALNLFLTAVFDVFYPYPREYRDGALTDISHQFVIGSNPYTIENVLPHTYTYGFLASLLNAAVTKITGFDLVITQHMITFLCMILLCILVGKEIFTTTKDISLFFVSLIVVLLYNSVTLRPEALAVLLTTAVLYFVKNGKKIDFKKIVTLSLAVITLFYIKQYFILLFLVLVIYFIFTQPKKNLLIFLITTIVLGIISFISISKIFPLYFSETLISYINYSGGPSMWVNHKTDWIIKQSIDFIRLHWVFVLLFIGTTVIGFIKSKKIIFANIYFIYSIVAIFSLTFLLGYNGGAYMSYYIQLLPLPLCLFSLPYFFQILKKYRWRKIVLTLFIALFIYEYAQYLSFPSLDQTKERHTWENATRYINKYKQHDIYLSPIFTTEALKNSWPIYDNGQTDFYVVGQLTPASQKFHFLSPQDKERAVRMISWQKDLDQKIINKKFALMVFPKGNHPIITETYLLKNYRMSQTMAVPINFGDLGASLTPLRMQPVEFWVPKTE